MQQQYSSTVSGVWYIAILVRDLLRCFSMEARHHLLSQYLARGSLKLSSPSPPACVNQSATGLRKPTPSRSVRRKWTARSNVPAVAFFRTGVRTDGLPTLMIVLLLLSVDVDFPQFWWASNTNDLMIMLLLCCCLLLIFHNFCCSRLKLYTR